MPSVRLQRLPVVVASSSQVALAGARSPARRPCPSPRRAASSSHSVAVRAGGRGPCSRAWVPVTSWQVAAPFGHSRPREIGESGSPSMSMISLVLDVDLLAAADGAVRADRRHDPVGARRARPQRGGAGERAARPSAERVLGELLAAGPEPGHAQATHR